MSKISKYQDMLTLENNLFLVREVVFENHHAIKPMFSYDVFPIPKQSLMTFDQDMLNQREQR